MDGITAFKEIAKAFVKILNRASLYGAGHQATIEAAGAFIKGLDVCLKDMGEITISAPEALLGRTPFEFMPQEKLSQDLLMPIDTLRQAGIIIRSHTEWFNGGEPRYEQGEAPGDERYGAYEGAYREGLQLPQDRKCAGGCGGGGEVRVVVWRPIMINSLFLPQIPRFKLQDGEG